MVHMDGLVYISLLGTAHLPRDPAGRRAVAYQRYIYDARTPALVFLAADVAASRTWDRSLTFDSQASHLNVMPPPGLGENLRFNSL